MKEKDLIVQPEIYCALSIVFDQSINVDVVLSNLKEFVLSEIKIRRPKYETSVCLDVAIVNNERLWHLDEALTKVFAQIHQIERMKEFVFEHGGTFYIDIAFYQYGTYPSLEFVGENMKKIRFLEADISIDAY